MSEATREALSLAPQFNDNPELASATVGVTPAAPTYDATPAMEGVRGAFNGAGRVVGELADVATSPAARPFTGALMSIFALTLAWKFVPKGVDLIPGMGKLPGFLSGPMRALITVGLSGMAAMGAYELGNTGFDLDKTMDNMGSNMSIAGEMISNGTSWVADKAGNTFD